MLSKVIAPNMWTWLSAKIGRDIVVLRVGAVSSGIFLMGVFFLHDFWVLVLLLFSYSFFRDALLPQMEVLTLGHLGTQANRYGQIRLWGSMGFIVSVMGLGYLFDSLSVAALPNYLAVTVMAIIVMSFIVPSAPVPLDIQHTTPSIFQAILRKEVIVFLLIGALLQFSHAPYYTFYTLFLEQHAYSKSTAGSLWALGVLAEVVLFIYAHRIFMRVSDYNLLSISLLLTAVRWGLIASFPDSLLLLGVAQLLHAASYGACHAASMRIIRFYFPGKLEVHGQALYVSFCFGAGGALGAFYASYSWSNYGAHFSFLMAAAACFIATLLAFFGPRPEKAQREKIDDSMD